MGEPARDSVISERYRLDEEIGVGGMARVWRARDLTLDRLVAVKFLFLREDRDQKVMIDRFLREARIAGSVRHPNVVDILDFGTTPDDGRPYMVMELLEGDSLEDRLGREPALSMKELLEIVIAALDGLGAVHKAGIVHRDVKPDNIFLLQDDGDVRPKLLDFGVSRTVDVTSGRRSALTTTAGHLVGTPEYMSPEQARGLKDVDWRTDLYSLGVLVYEALTGILPYDAEARGDLIIEIVGGGAASLFEVRPEVGEPLSRVIEKAMAGKREDRYQSAKEMGAALREVVAESLGDDARGSLPTIVPARHQLAEELAASAGARVGTLDGDLEWGGSAVPSFGASPEAGSEPARQKLGNDRWTVDAELPIPKARRPVPWGIVAAVAMTMLGVVGWWALSDPAPRPADPTPVAQPTREVPMPPAPLEQPEPAPEELEVPPTRVTIALAGLPENASALLDGELVEVEQGAISLLQDGEEHEIRVEAPQRRPWTVTHRADGDGEYDVEMRRVRPAGGDTGRRRGTRGGSGVYRDLDY